MRTSQPAPKSKYIDVLVETVESVKRLLAEGVSPEALDAEGATPLIAAAIAKDLAIMELLVAAGANVNRVLVAADSSGRVQGSSKSGAIGTALLAAASVGMVDGIELLLDCGADPRIVSGSQRNLAHLLFNSAMQEYAAGNPGHFAALLERTLRYGVGINHQDSNGWSPLHLAVKARVSPASLDILIDQGADLDLRDGKGQRPIHFAARMADVATIEWLALNGADVNATDFLGRSAVFECRDHDAMQALVAHGVQIDQLDIHGKTVLAHRIADAEPGFAPTVQASILIAAGASPDAPGFTGDTPRTIAKRRRFTDVSQLMVASDARNAMSRSIRAAKPR